MENNQMNKLVFWILQIFPPLFLLILVWTPIDIGSMFLWGPAFFSVLVSIINIISYPTSKGPITLTGKKTKNKDIKQLVRPVLTTAIVIISLYSVTMSLNIAKKYAMEIANQIQNDCNQNSACPKHIEGWQIRNDTFKSDIVYGGLAKYRILYRPNGTEFEIIVRRSIDGFFKIEGGKGKTLKIQERSP